MSLTTLMQDIDDWCGTPTPGHPPRPPWLRDILTAVVLAELSANLSGTDEGRSLYAAARLLEQPSEVRGAAAGPLGAGPRDRRTGGPCRATPRHSWPPPGRAL
jgi:hypothetical protein